MRTATSPARANARSAPSKSPSSSTATWFPRHAERGLLPPRLRSCRFISGGGGEFRKPLNEKLWSRVDRLIFDSADWQNARRSIRHRARDRQLHREQTPSFATSTGPASSAPATRSPSFSTTPASWPIATRIRKVSIKTAKKLTGLFLLGWLAAQMGWNHQTLLGKESFVSAEGITVEFEIEEVPGEAISECSFTKNVRFEITREKGRLTTPGSSEITPAKSPCS